MAKKMRAKKIRFDRVVVEVEVVARRLCWDGNICWGGPGSEFGQFSGPGARFLHIIA